MFLFASIFLGTLAGGFFWTGFPIFFHASQDTNVSLASIYVFATFGSLIFSLIGGYLSDIIDFRKIAVISNFLSFFFISLFFVLTSIKQIVPNFFVLLLLPVLYFNFALGEASESIWILKSTGEKHLRSRFFDRVILSFVAKLTGFAFGPILFTQLNHYTLIICLVLFFLSAGIQTILVLYEKNLPLRTQAESNRIKKISLQNLILLTKNRSLLGVTILTGALSVPFNVLVANYLLKVGQPIDVSIFWCFGGLAAILGMLILRKIKLKNPDKIVFSISLGLIFFLGLCFLTKNSVLIILAASFYIFLGTFFTVQVRLQILERSDFHVIGSSAGVLNCLMDAGIFLGMLLSSSQLLQNHIFIVIIFSLLLILRYISFVRLKNTEVSPEILLPTLL